MDEARDSLLPILRSGKYIDKVTSLELDCSQVIWIIITDIGRQLIETYYSQELKHLTDAARLQEPLNRLNALLESEFRETLSVPITGCIDTFVPFLPFSPDEKLAIVHRYFLDLAATVKKPIQLKKAPKRHIGQCELDTLDDGYLCDGIVKSYYVQELGARSLVQGVAERIEHELYREYIKKGRRMTSHTSKGSIESWTIGTYTVWHDPSKDDLNIFARGGPIVSP
ncbi:hypothetical protein EV356DRAFT_575757 [Viridothelium virens]|uniref:Uncharacterized protein n=1 Tax=Viridothelium virens TaxID=1048519 RepID=A0A6A6HDV0_VIRVR|nr:hypothetical protein EV356DRAFT_575757 [Viridothelium virens]